MRLSALTFAVTVGLALGLPLAAEQSAPRTHRLEATPETVAYGHYWSETTPALRIASGDVIDVDTLLTNSPRGLRAAGVPDEKIQASLVAVTEGIPPGDPRRGPGGHILTGPVYVEGAEPGDVLEVKVLSIDLPIDYGYNGCSGYLPGNCGERAGRTRIFQLDRQAMTSEFAPGIVSPLKPFFGSMGVAPAPELGRVSSNPPGRHAGNLDNRELVAGSTLWIPVFVPGALFEVGDGHAVQHRGPRRHHAARRSPQPGSAREDAEEHLQVSGAGMGMLDTSAGPKVNKQPPTRQESSWRTSPRLPLHQARERTPRPIWSARAGSCREWCSPRGTAWSRCSARAAWARSIAPTI
jgi:hypothetical protein